ncbi:MAG: alanine--tRNA ligase [Crocinitomicaceae bacterium]|nr:alanine--tRNA ligase [Crocinitomicaceae bacterium]
MKVSEIRATFFDYFKAKGHEIQPSALMVVKNDPTLMFTNAGMNQFKDYFLGNTDPKSKRIANSQKCLRVSGKHNDLEEVGVDTYHHTMFEMLGNWSFGDYFKKEAIDWAWELLTEVYKLDKSRLYVTVFEGDKIDGTKEDMEAISFWSKHINSEEIIKCSKKDNFWEMGDVGPCGPCSEIHMDIRSDYERSKVKGRDLVNKDHPQVIEIWNLVFMEYLRKADRSLVPLPQKHVDTGMGLERLAVALQGKKSNYDIDLFQSLIKKTEELSKIKYGANPKTDIALRIVSDHVRAISFSIADGQLPSNTGAGYVIRRILRRAVRYGYQVLEIKEPFMFDIAITLVEQMGEAYPELTNQKSLIEKVIKEEEKSFFRTLEQGIKKINLTINSHKEKKQEKMSSLHVFELYDTYGFPIDLTSLIAKENNIEIDIEGFQKLLEEQKQRSRKASEIDTSDWIAICDQKATQFVGYDTSSTETKILRYRKVNTPKKDYFQLVLDKTPFYPEGGGQVGDTGFFEIENEKIKIFNTKKENELILHYASSLPKNLSKKGIAIVDEKRRKKISANHSATHLLHHALRKVLGEHVEQKGSLVNERYLRFDFSHFSKMKEEELQQVQELVLEQINNGVPLTEHREIPLNEAKKMGAMALFGEKYGEKVRAIQFGNSIELCGGIHVSSTSSIGMFTILSEGAVAAGVRRIEAISGMEAEKYFIGKAKIVDEVCKTLKTQKDIVKTIETILSKNHELQKQIEELNKEKIQLLKNTLTKKITQINGINFLGAQVHLPNSSIKDLLFQLKNQNDNFFAVIGNSENEKCGISIIISDNLVKEKQLNASDLVKAVSHYINGGGGGQSFFATAGGRKKEGLKKAIEEIRKTIQES